MHPVFIIFFNNQIKMINKNKYIFLSNKNFLISLKFIAKTGTRTTTIKKLLMQNA
jgi:hypothetical protein